MTLRSRDKVALTVVAGALAILAFYLFVLRPVQNKASNLGAQLSAQQQTLANDQSTYAAGKAAEAELRKDRPAWKALRHAVPNTADIPMLLRVLQASTDAVSVRFSSVSLSGGSSSGSDTTTTTGSGSGSGSATSVPVSLTFTGTYTHLEQALRRINHLVTVSGNHVRGSGPLLTVSNVALSGTEPKLKAQLTASIYQLAGTSSSDSSSSASGTS